MFLLIHRRAYVWSFNPVFPGACSSPVQRKPKLHIQIKFIIAQLNKINVGFENCFVYVPIAPTL